MNKEERNQAIEKVRELYKSYRLIEGLEREIGEYIKLIEYKQREQKELNNLHVDEEEGSVPHMKKRFAVVQIKKFTQWKLLQICTKVLGS